MTKNKEEQNQIELLINAAKSGDLQQIQELIKKNTNINAVDSSGKTALMHAAQNGHRDIVRLLLNYGARANVLNKIDISALFYAIEGGYEEIAIDIIKFINIDNPEKTFMHAIDKGCVNVVLKLIEENPRLIKPQDPLLYAIEKGNENIALAIMKAYPTNYDIEKTLIHAIDKGCVSVVLELIEKNPNLLMQQQIHKNPLLYTIEKGNEEIALAIMKAYPTNYDIERTLIHAIDKGCVRVVLELIEKNPNLRIQSINDSTPLIYALQQNIYVIQKGKVDVAKALIAKNVDINAQDKDDKTALMHALDPYNLYSLKSYQGQRSGEPRDYMYAYRDMILSLINHPSADLNLKDRNGDTALMYFSGSETNFMIARALIEKGADINIANNSGRTALMLAASEGNLTLVKFLLKQPGIEPDQLNKTLDEVIEFKIPGRAVDDKIIETLLKAGATLDETKYKDIVIEPKIKNKAEKYKEELSDPDLKILRNIKEGRIEFDSLNQNFDLAKKKEKLISKMRYISILGYHEQMHNNLKKFLSETLELDIDGLSDTQIEKLGKTVKKIITNDQIEKIHNKSYSEKLAEELIIKVEMMKIKNRQNSEKSEDRSFADRATASKTTQGKSR